MNCKQSYKRLSRTSVILNLLLCLGAVFLVERLVPAVSTILKQNADSVNAASIMLESMALNPYVRGKSPQEDQFWKAMDLAQRNIAFEGEVQVLKKIEEYAVQYWSGNFEMKEPLLIAIRELLVLNVEDMKSKQQKVRRLGLSGTWALAFLLILSLGFQLFFKQRVLLTLVEPIGEFSKVLKEFTGGNSLRRFYSADATRDIQEAGRLLNDILDRHKK